MVMLYETYNPHKLTITLHETHSPHKLTIMMGETHSPHKLTITLGETQSTQAHDHVGKTSHATLETNSCSFWVEPTNHSWKVKSWSRLKDNTVHTWWRKSCSHWGNTLSLSPAWEGLYSHGIALCESNQDSNTRKKSMSQIWKIDHNPQQKTHDLSRENQSGLSCHDPTKDKL